MIISRSYEIVKHFFRDYEILSYCTSERGIYLVKVDNIFSLMNENGITAKELSEKTGISSGNISDWKSGRSTPKAEALIKIATLFNVSVDYLLDNTVEQHEITHARKVIKRLYGECDADIAGVEKKLGVNYTTFRSWINGYGDALNSASGLSALAQLFDVSVDYLLGRTDDPNQQPGQENIKFDEFTYAMYEESKELTEEDKQMLLDFARRLKTRVAEEKRLNGEG